MIFWNLSLDWPPLGLHFFSYYSRVLQLSPPQLPSLRAATSSSVSPPPFGLRNASFLCRAYLHPVIVVSFVLSLNRRARVHSLDFRLSDQTAETALNELALFCPRFVSYRPLICGLYNSSSAEEFEERGG